MLFIYKTLNSEKTAQYYTQTTRSKTANDRHLSLKNEASPFQCFILKVNQGKNLDHPTNRWRLFERWWANVVTLKGWKKEANLHLTALKHLCVIGRECNR